MKSVLKYRQQEQNSCFSSEKIIKDDPQKNREIIVEKKREFSAEIRAKFQRKN